MREARDEAKSEIEAYRNSKEEEFKKFEAEVLIVHFVLPGQTHADGCFYIAYAREPSSRSRGKQRGRRPDQVD